MRKESVSDAITEDATTAISAAHLLHPSEHFNHPRDVLAAQDIGDDEKRAILASWASDIFAIESIPGFRLYPGTDNAVSYDDIIEALKALDKDDEQSGKLGSSSPFNLQRTNRGRPKVRRFGGLGLCSYRKGDMRRRPFEI